LREGRGGWLTHASAFFYIRRLTASGQTAHSWIILAVSLVPDAVIAKSDCITVSSRVEHVLLFNACPSALSTSRRLLSCSVEFHNFCTSLPLVPWVEARWQFKAWIIMLMLARSYSRRPPSKGRAGLGKSWSHAHRHGWPQLQFVILHFRQGVEKKGTHRRTHIAVLQC